MRMLGPEEVPVLVRQQNAAYPKRALVTCPRLPYQYHRRRYCSALPEKWYSSFTQTPSAWFQRGLLPLVAALLGLGLEGGASCLSGAGGSSQ